MSLEAQVAKWGIKGTAMAALAAVLVLVMIWGAVSGRWYVWRAQVWRDRAVAAAEQAKAQAAIATRSQTTIDVGQVAQERIDRVQIEVIQPAEQSAQRIDRVRDESENVAVPAGALPDADVVRELEAGAEAYAGATSDLRRKGTR